MRRSYRWLCSVAILTALYIPFFCDAQDTSRRKALDNRFESFDQSRTLDIFKASLCGFQDFGEARANCIDERETAIDKADTNIIRHTIIRGSKGIRGNKGKYVNTLICYYIDKKICKIIIQKQIGEELLCDSKIYLLNETVILQNDRLAKVNPAEYVQEAKAIFKP